MSGDQEEEPMDVEFNDCKTQTFTKQVEEAADFSDCKTQTSTKQVEEAANEDEAKVILSVEGPDFTPKKFESELQKAFQTLFNRNDIKGEIKVLSASQDGTVSLSIRPSSAEAELFPGQVLTTREKTEFKITSVNLTPSNAVKPVDDNVSLFSSAPTAASQNEHGLLGEQSTDDSAVGDEKYARIVPVSQFWYVSHIFKDEIQRIGRENGVEILPEVKVNFRVNQKDGNAEKASADFTNLVQSHFRETGSSSVPLKKVGSLEWENMLQVMKESDHQLLLTLSSEEIIAFGPTRSQYAFTKLLQKTSISTNFQDEESASSFPNITEKTRCDMTWHSMSIKDPAMADGLTIEEDNWKLITTSFSKDLEKIKTKFGVDFKESGFTQGKTTVKTYYKRSGGNRSMESHALRALLRLYQKVATSPLNASGLLGDSSKNWFSVDGESEGASAEPFMNGQSRNTEASAVGGATGGKDEEERCPICLDEFKNKQQLKCKHEFCEECLEHSKKVSGAMCPVCKDVFGLIEGDQPDGQMRWHKSGPSLPGFPHCGTICIDYSIPGGTQTEKHPKPGKFYSGIFRTAYLPDNKEGNEVLLLLKKAFDQRLIFTIGTSRTTGLDNQVTWNDIHHKTSMTGGPQSFGYPDPGYLSRVKDELKAKGIKF